MERIERTEHIQKVGDFRRKALLILQSHTTQGMCHVNTKCYYCTRSVRIWRLRKKNCLYGLVGSFLYFYTPTYVVVRYRLSLI